MGFCFFNNIAVAARYAQGKGMERVLVVDWDAHHGNGIERIFYRDPSVLYFLVHRAMSYPGTGWTEDTGEGPGEGYNINIPLPVGAGDLDYTEVFERLLAPVCKQFRPDIILVAAGQDACRGDPIGGMGLSEKGFGRLGSIVAGLALQACSGRLVAVLEGGYALGAMARSTVEILKSFVLSGEGQCPPGGNAGSDTVRSETLRAIEQAVRILGTHWRF